MQGFIIGIDASNIHEGGGVSHLCNLLSSLNPSVHGIKRIIVWSGDKTLNLLAGRPWLEKSKLPEWGRLRPVKQLFWQYLRLPRAAREAECDLLFAPGGSCSSTFKPIATMSQNLLPFEWPELWRFGVSIVTLRLLLLRNIQSRSFRHAAGVVFLTKYARKRVCEVAGRLNGATIIIPHGISSRFKVAPKEQRSISEYNSTSPYKILYVSIIDQYKHQWYLVEAVAELRQKGLPLQLDLVGPSYPPALSRLKKTLARFDPQGEWAQYRGTIPYADLCQTYSQADLGVFASSCENMPNILLETMAAGLPIACSDRGPMPEVLGETGVFFDPEKPRDIAKALRELIDSPQLRAEKAEESFLRAQPFSWERCASDTFAFLAKLAHQHRN